MESPEKNDFVPASGSLSEVLRPRDEDESPFNDSRGIEIERIRAILRNDDASPTEDNPGNLSYLLELSNTDNRTPEGSENVSPDEPVELAMPEGPEASTESISLPTNEKEATDSDDHETAETVTTPPEAEQEVSPDILSAGQNETAKSSSPGPESAVTPEEEAQEELSAYLQSPERPEPEDELTRDLLENAEDSSQFQEVQQAQERGEDPQEGCSQVEESADESGNYIPVEEYMKEWKRKNLPGEYSSIQHIKKELLMLAKCLRLKQGSKFKPEVVFKGLLPEYPAPPGYLEKRIRMYLQQTNRTLKPPTVKQEEESFSSSSDTNSTVIFRSLSRGSNSAFYAAQCGSPLAEESEDEFMSCDSSQVSPKDQ